MDARKLIKALEKAEYIKEITTPTTLPQVDGTSMKAEICEYVELKEDPNWIALKKLVVGGVRVELTKPKGT